MKYNPLIPPLSVQSLAEFLRDLAYSKKLFHSVDWSLSVSPPNEGDAAIRHLGSICTHARSRPVTKRIYLSFCYTEDMGIHDVKATVEGNTVRHEQSMTFEAFRSYAMSLFDADSLYAPERVRERQQKRPTKDAPTLLEFAAFLCSFSPASGEAVDWSLRVLHPRDIWDDVAYSGGLWTHYPSAIPPAAPFHSISFSYSRTWGIYDVSAWNNKIKYAEIKRTDLNGLKRLAENLFTSTSNELEDAI